MNGIAAVHALERTEWRRDASVPGPVEATEGEMSPACEVPPELNGERLASRAVYVRAYPSLTVRSRLD
jgi:hypothetical protein